MPRHAVDLGHRSENKQVASRRAMGREAVSGVQIVDRACSVLLKGQRADDSAKRMRAYLQTS